MAGTEDTEPERYPLGAPIRPEKVEPVEEWRALDPSKPWIQTHSVTGQMRNVRPTPADAPVPYPWPNYPNFQP